MSSIRDIFSSSGPLASSLPGYTPREQQIEMADQVSQAIEQSDTLIVEAGTGTGKTYAYLAPVIHSGKKVMISTGTKTLQDQLFKRDLPALCKALDVQPRISLLKGRQNYLCHHRLEKTLMQGRLPFKEQIDELQRIKQWSISTVDGDISELTEIPESSTIWPQVTSNADNCLGSDCDYHERCHVIEARAAAHKSDIVVCNHHLFFSDMALQREGVADLLPEVDAYIFDEAHQLAEIGHQFLGYSFSSGQIKSLLTDTLASVSAEAPEAKKNFSEFGDEISETLKNLQRFLDRLHSRGSWTDFFDHPRVSETITELVNRLAVYCGHLEEIRIRGTELQNCFERCESICIALDEMTQLNPKFIQWYEVRKNTFSLHNTPLEVATSFNERIKESHQAWIFTSATISINNEFGYFKHRLGIKKATCASWPSPFDYEKNSLLYLPQGMPQPNDAKFIPSLVEKALPVLRITKGKAFLLFTSLSALNAAAELLKNTEFNLFIQGTMPKGKLLSEFKNSRNGILLGSASFWEGVDVKGDALSLVCIDKLPFASPADPIIKAKINNIREKGGEPFWQYQLPHAVIALKQGVGRLIRDEDDRGILMICDPRLSSRNYGKIFFDSLPAVPVSRQLEDIKRFFNPAEQNSEHEISMH